MPALQVQPAHEQPELDWRAVVAAARAAQLRVSGDQMLTDTFKCVPLRLTHGC